jgi:hypothetical protein
MFEGRSLDQLNRIYNFKLKTPPWKERLDAAVFRGSCYPTANSSNESSAAYQPRLQLARQARASTYTHTDRMHMLKQFST